MKNKLSIKQKKTLARILISLVAFAAVFTADKIAGLEYVFTGKYAWLFPFALYLAIYVVIGYDVLWRAARNISHGQIFDENFLMCLATLGAFALAIYRGVEGMEIEGFDEACAVLLFYQVGEFFQDYATCRSRKSISGLMDLRPDYANVLRNGSLVKTDPEDVAVGEIIVVNPGEKVPLDGIVEEGETSFDTKALTGESLPRFVKPGDAVISGFVNIDTRINVRVEKEFYDSTVSRILDLVENAASEKSKAENFITKFAKYYTPAVVGVALLLALIPGALTGEWSVWVYRALSFLVVSCPCALVISIPLSFFAGIGAASRYGILIKGSNYLEKLNKADIFVFDKTGTLTKGNFALTEIETAAGVSENEVLRLAAVAESGSSHPIALSVTKAYSGKIESGYTLTNRAGSGVVATKNGDTVVCGNEKLMEEYGIGFVPCALAGTPVYVARNGEYKGCLLIRDEIKPESRDVVEKLDSMGAKTVMLTGDNPRIAAEVADQIGVSAFEASLLPGDKVEKVERMLADKGKNDVLCFVGDGINDAPVLMRSDIGIAMGGVGSDAAIEASDIVLMHDDLKGIPLAKRIARKTMAVVYQNIIFSVAVKAAILILSALGLANMWVAVFGDVGVAVIAILNAMRVNGKYASDTERSR